MIYAHMFGDRKQIFPAANVYLISFHFLFSFRIDIEKYNLDPSLEKLSASNMEIINSTIWKIPISREIILLLKVTTHPITMKHYNFYIKLTK